MKMIFSNKMLTALTFVGLAFNQGFAEEDSCCGEGGFSYKNLTLTLRNSINFSKNNTTREDRDRDDFKGTAPTSSWLSNREYKTYNLNPRVLWQAPDANYFVQLSGYYGWVLDGRSVGYPNRWDVDGHVYGVGIKTGYSLKVCDLFTFVPYVGYRYDATHTRISHQKLVKSTPDSYISQNGNKFHSYLNIPYVGFEIDFTSTFFDCYKVQFATSYELGYGWGRGNHKVSHVFINSSPNTSRYGSHIKYQDMIAHDFAIAAAHTFCKHWTVGIELDYSTIYNTHNLPVKLQHNDRVVKAGQYTKSQYHVISDDVTQTFSIILGLAYSFGDAAAWITR